MRLLIKEYIRSLRERDELDKILPDVLSEMGYTIIARPKRGVREHGVDIAAIGPDQTSDEQALYLLSVKSGNLGRADWEISGLQALRPSLNEILDVYIPKKIPKRYKSLKIYIALCFGGDIQTDVRENVDSFTDENTQAGKIEFLEWNGDVITEFIVKGILRENIFPNALQSEFRKTLAFVDQPSVCFNHFQRFVWKARDIPIKSKKDRLRLLRQIYLASWNVYVWCRAEGNLDAAYLCSEFAALQSWDLSRQHIETNSAASKKLSSIFFSQLEFYQLIGDEYVEKHVIPYSEVKDGLAACVQSNSNLDVTLKLFDIIGRVSLFGIWLVFLSNEQPKLAGSLGDSLNKTIDCLINIIENNKALFAPLRDDHAIEIMLAGLLLKLASENEWLTYWVSQVTQTCVFSHRRGINYPCVFREYSDLAAHPKNVEGYQEGATEGSVLYPTLAIWLAILKEEKTLSSLQLFQEQCMVHSTWQLWVPSKDSEELLYSNKEQHGTAVSPVDTSLGIDGLIKYVQRIAKDNEEINSLSAMKYKMWPLILMACRHHRVPVPPHFWLLSNR